MSWWIARGGMGWHHRPGCACIKCRKARMEHEREQRQKEEAMERLRYWRKVTESRDRIGDGYPKKVVGIPKLKICANKDCGRGFYQHQSTDSEFCRQCVDEMKRQELQLESAMLDWLKKRDAWRNYLRERGEDPDEG